MTSLERSHAFASLTAAASRVGQMEFLGATFLGGEVVKTIRKGIADEEYDMRPRLARA